MKRIQGFKQLSIAGVLGLTLAGCFGPSTAVTRSFTLTAAVSPGAGTASGVRLGVAPTKIPEYLLSSSVVVRKDATEVDYLTDALWAEPLDVGFERVLAANLSALIPTDRVQIGAWRAGDVTHEIYVTVERFDVDKAGHGTLTAWWRITAPGGAKVLKSGQARLSKDGKPPGKEPQNIVVTMNELLEEFSKTLAEAVRQAEQ
jgi:uncharacterized lipoprotein YmbA